MAVRRSMVVAAAAALIALAITGSGCGTQIAGIGCQSDADCKAGRCLDKVCVRETDCNPACEAHQDCVATECRDAFQAIRIESPADGARVTGGFEVSAQLVARDGSTRAPPASLNARLTRTSGETLDASLAWDAATQRYRGQIEVTQGGGYGLRASYPASSLAADISLHVDLCGSPCAVDQECFEDACQTAFDAVMIDAPLMNGWTDTPLKIDARLRRVENAVRAYPAALAVVVVGPAEERYTGELALTDAGQYHGEIAVTRGGRHQITVSLAESALESEIVVTVNLCTAACSATTECLGETCAPSFARIDIVSPALDESVGLEFPVEAQLIRAQGARGPFPSTLGMRACRGGTTCATAVVPRAGDDGTFRATMRVALGGRYDVQVEYGDAALMANVAVYVDACDTPCGAEEVCLEQSCQPGYAAIAVGAPVEGTRIDQQVAVEATLVPARKSVAAPQELRLRATHVATGALESVTLNPGGSELVYQGTFAPTRGGAYLLRAAWMRTDQTLLLESPPVAAIATRCTTPCGTWEECADGVCTGVFGGVAITAPSANATEGPVVHVAAHIERAVASGKPSPLTLQGAAQTTTTPPTVESFVLRQVGQSDDYAGDWNPGGEGEYDVRATIPETGQQSADVRVAIDKTPPQFAITWAAPSRRTIEIDPEPGYASALRRDEVVVLKVTSADADVDVSTVELNVRGATGTGTSSIPLTQSAGTCDTAMCLEGTVDLADSALEMKAFRGNFTAEVVGKDLRGNEAAMPTSAAVPVTRWRWAYDGLAGPIKTAPAVGSTGVVYVGTSLNASPWGKVIAVGSDGSLAWSFLTDGPVESSVAIGEVNGAETAFVSGTHRTTANTVEGAMWKIDSGSSTATLLCSGGTKSSASIAVSTTQIPSDISPVPTAFGIFASGTSSQIVAARATGTVGTCIVGYPGVESDSSTGIAFASGTAFFGDKSGGLQSSAFTAFGSWVAATGFPVTISAGSRPTNPAITPSGVGITGGVGATKICVVPLVGGSSSCLTTTSTIWNLIVDSTGQFIAGADDGQLYFAPATLASVTTVPLSTNPSDNTISVAAPALGSDSTLYVATQGGKLFARTSTGAAIWEVSLGAGSDSSPALDCARDSTGTPISRPGVLYVGADDGKLYAFTVDSHGIDTTSPWPKFHRDPQNTGDASRNLSQFACP